MLQCSTTDNHELRVSVLCRSYVTTLILGDDFAPRLNSSTAAQLRRDIAATDWKAHVAGLLNVQDYLDRYKQVRHCVLKVVRLYVSVLGCNSRIQWIHVVIFFRSKC